MLLRAFANDADDVFETLRGAHRRTAEFEDVSHGVVSFVFSLRRNEKAHRVPRSGGGQKTNANEEFVLVHRAGCAAGGREELHPRQRMHMQMHIHIEMCAARLRKLVV
jgi:hypothetical protein